MKIMILDQKMKIPQIIPLMSRVTQGMSAGPGTAATPLCGPLRASERPAKTAEHPGSGMGFQHSYYKIE